jgi:hypothetical protein
MGALDGTLVTYVGRHSLQIADAGSRRSTPAS